MTTPPKFLALLHLRSLQMAVTVAAYAIARPSSSKQIKCPPRPMAHPCRFSSSVNQRTADYTVFRRGRRERTRFRTPQHRDGQRERERERVIRALTQAPGTRVWVYVPLAASGGRLWYCSRMHKHNSKPCAVFQYPYYPYSYYLVGRSNSNRGGKKCTERTRMV